MVEVTPIFPGDIIDTLSIHAAAAEKRASRPLFDSVDWETVTLGYHHSSLGDWVQILHAALRRKARHEAGGEDVGIVTTQDLNEEVERFKRASGRITTPKSGNYV